MAWILEGLEVTVNMIDDILVFGKTKSEHDQHLQLVLTRLSKAGVTLDKCCFVLSLMSCLDVSADKIRLDSGKLSAVKSMDPLMDVVGCFWAW